MALPPNALTVDTHEYIGLIVSIMIRNSRTSMADAPRLAQLLLGKEGGAVSYMEIASRPQCQIISCFSRGQRGQVIKSPQVSVTLRECPASNYPSDLV